MTVPSSTYGQNINMPLPMPIQRPLEAHSDDLKPKPNEIVFSNEEAQLAMLGKKV